MLILISYEVIAFMNIVATGRNIAIAFMNTVATSRNIAIPFRNMII